MNKQINGYLKVQFRKLRCFVANLNIDQFTRFCANFLGEKMRLCYFLRLFQVCLMVVFIVIVAFIVITIIIVIVLVVIVIIVVIAIIVIRRH